jgi:L-ascorbate metabolism protein UlaG (beta-lactamase superfamily)
MAFVTMVADYEVNTMIDQIRWLGHGGFMIQGPPLIYINPWRVIRKAFHADVILVSNDHYDHCSLADIDKLRGPNTLVVGNERVTRQIEGCFVLRPWQSVTVDCARITAVPAYSPNDFRHPIADGGLGFVISLQMYDIYYAGDTQAIPEMERIHPDIAILPIDGNGTLTVSEAAQVIRRMRPRWVIPSNWGTSHSGGAQADAENLKEMVGSTSEVHILPVTN